MSADGAAAAPLLPPAGSGVETGRSAAVSKKKKDGGSSESKKKPSVKKQKKTEGGTSVSLEIDERSHEDSVAQVGKEEVPGKADFSDIKDPEVLGVRLVGAQGGSEDQGPCKGTPILSKKGVRDYFKAKHPDLKMSAEFMAAAEDKTIRQAIDLSASRAREAGRKILKATDA